MGENDEEALNALVDIRCVVNESYTGYDLVFIFSENEFFENTVRDHIKWLNARSI